jgi:hypothetical protein
MCILLWAIFSPVVGKFSHSEIRVSKRPLPAKSIAVDIDQDTENGSGVLIGWR